MSPDRCRSRLPRIRSHADCEWTRHRAVTCISIMALLASLILSMPAAHIRAAGNLQTSNCVTTKTDYSVTLCLIAPSPNEPISNDPTIQATVEIDDPSIHVLSVVFKLDKRNILSDFDPAYEFVLPVSNWVDGPHVLSAAVNLSDDTQSNLTSTTLTFHTGTNSITAPSTTFVPTPGRPAAAGEQFVLAAVGDGAGGSPESAAVTSMIDSWNPNLFLYLGDVYNGGTVAEFENWYAPETYFGRFKNITDPTIGNHEYGSSNGPVGYMQYWGNPPHYYSVDTAGWHIVSLDSNPTFDETDPDSEQMQWLVNDLESNQLGCTLVYFHHPPFSVGPHGNSKELTDLWRILVQHHVTIVLTGHDHEYERWQPLDENGNVSPSGTVSLVVGTGGQSEYGAQRDDDRLAGPALMTYGALRMGLNPDGADLQFIETDGHVADSSVVSCGSPDQQTDGTPPTVPGSPVATRNADGSLALSWSPSIDDTGIAAYDIFRSGELVGSVPPASNYFEPKNEGDSTYTVVARDATGNNSAASEEASPTGDTDPGVIFSDDFSSGSLTRWSDVNDLSVEPEYRGGKNVIARARGSLSPTYARTDFPGFPLNQDQFNLSVTIDFFIRMQGDNPSVLFRLMGPDDASLFGIYVGASGKIGLYDDISQSGLDSSVGVSLGEWHQLTANLTGPLQSPSLTLSIDDTPVHDIAVAIDLRDLQIAGIQLGDSRSNRLYDISFRSVVVRIDPSHSTTSPIRLLLARNSQTPIGIQFRTTGLLPNEEFADERQVSIAPKGPISPENWWRDGLRRHVSGPAGREREGPRSYVSR